MTAPINSIIDLVSNLQNILYATCIGRKMTLATNKKFITSSSKFINWEMVERLKQLDLKHHNDTLTEILVLLNKNGPNRVRKIQTSCEQKKYHETEFEVHALKSSLSYVGAHRIIGICSYIEQQIRQCNYTKIEKYCYSLAPELSKVLDALNAYCETTKSTTNESN